MRLFVRSGVHQYLEFKTFDKVVHFILHANEMHQISLAAQDGRKFLPVPNSRSDIFSSDVVDLKEKRLLMKFIQTCSAADNDYLRGMQALLLLLLLLLLLSCTC